MAFGINKKTSADAGADTAAKLEKKAPRTPKAPKDKFAPREKKPKGLRSPKPSASAKINKDKKKQFVLLIGDEGAILVFTEGNKVVRRLFAASPQPGSTEAIVKLMEANPKVPVTLLIDNIDQQYVRQNFPPVSSLSVNGLVKRRFERDFQAEDLKAALPLGREKTGRKEWSFLLIALTKTPVLSEWIDLISELPNEFKGIYLVPVEASIYFSMLSRAVGIHFPKPWQLLVTHNKVSGFRQVVINEGKLVFTRITQIMDDAIPAVIAGNIEQEILNTIEYLKRLTFNEANGLDIMVISSQDVNEALDLKRFGFATGHALTPLEVADALGFDQAALSADRFGDVVMATAFIRAKKRILRFSTAYTDSLAKLYQARLAANVATALLVLLLLGLSVMNIIGLLENNTATEQNITQRQTEQTRLKTLKTSVDALDTNLSFKSAVVSVHDAYMQDSPLPIDFINSFSTYLTDEHRITSIEWKVTMPKGPGSNVAPPPGSDGPKGPVVIKVEMSFNGTYEDIEALAKSVQFFVDNLKLRMSDYVITHEPFPWQSGGTSGLEISFDQQQSEGIKEGDTRLTLTFVGPKKSDTPAGTPGGQP